MRLIRNFVSSIRSLAANTLSQGEQFWWRPANISFASETQTVAGEAVSADSLMTSATCFACTKALAETIAGLPSSVYRSSAIKKEADPSSPAHELLVDQPNPEMDAFTFWEIAVTRLTNNGNFFAEIERDNRDRPVALWPIHPSRVQPMRDHNDGSLYWEIASDYTGSPEYSDPTWRAANLRYLGTHNMLNIVGFGSRNGIMSPGMLPGTEEIAMDFAIRRYGGSFFKEGAVPLGVVEHPKFIDNPVKRKQFFSDINEVHSSKRHQIGVLWEGAKYNQVGIAPEQAQFLETRKFTSEQLCKFYGVPPAIVGDYEHSKFATADSMIRAFVMITLRNLAVRVEKAINRQVLNVRTPQGKLERAFTKNLIYQIAIDGLLRGDPKTQADAWAAYRQMGVAKTNEIREDIGLNPIDGEAGEYIIVNGGVARLDRIDEQGSRPNARNDAPQPPPKQDASLPTFDRERLADALGSMVERPVAVAGFDPREAIISTMVKVASSSVARINKITDTQIQRWREQDPSIVAAKMPEFFAKQLARLEEALEPVADLAGSLGSYHGENLPAEIARAYHDAWAALDNYAIFDANNHPTLDIEEIVHAATSC
jgi:HK97 family phage portal protein